MAQVTAVNISEKKGVRKHEVPYIDVKYRHGIVGDAHAGDWHRQISLLADESVDTMRAICQLELDAGIFAENINTRGIELKTLPVGTRLPRCPRNFNPEGIKCTSSATTTARSSARRANA